MISPAWWLLARREAALLLRDAHGLAVLFLMPVTFVLVMSLALQPTLDERVGIGVYLDDQDDTELSGRLRAELEDLELLELTADEAEAQAQAILRITEGFEDALLAEDLERAGLRLEVDAALPADSRALLTIGVQQVAGRLVVEEFLIPPGEAGDWVTELPLQTVTTDPEGREVALPSAVEQNVPAWLIFGMFFAVVPLSGTVIRDRDRGMLARFRAAGVGAWDLMASRFATYGLVNLAQAACMVAVGIWLVPALGGGQFTVQGPWSALLVMILATSVAAVGFALLVAMICRTQLQAVATGGAVTLLMAAIGGIMVPAFAMPPVMQELSRLSPLNWALDGMVSTITGTGSWNEVAGHALALVTIGLICLIVAAMVFRRQEP